MTPIKESIFILDVILNYILLLGLAFSILFPKKRIWPPPQKCSWQYWATWIFYYLVLCLNATLILLDWNTWFIPKEVRFFVGVPVVIIGIFLAISGMRTLGLKNTLGLRDKFVVSGIYCFTRNPQYLGDIFFLLGIALVANSLYVFVVHLLAILVFLFTPFSEELWLEKQYGSPYKDYKKSTARFF